MINAVIDSSIHINPTDIPDNILQGIYSRLTIPNPQRKLAEREMLWNAKKIPEFIKLYKNVSHNELILPRGFQAEFEDLLENNELRIHYNFTIYHPMEQCFSNVEIISLRDYQSEAIEKLAGISNGIYKAPTGSGKTRCMLELIRSLKQKTLVICEKLDIAKQWEETARGFGFKVGMVNEESWSVGFDLTICLRQTLLSRLDKLTGYKWFDTWGMVVLDECHHASAETMFELLGRFPAYYRFGCSATPDSDEDLFPIARAVIGPIVHESTPDQIGEHLVIPSVKVVKTEFEYPYRPTMRLNNGRVQRNNYNDIMSELEKNRARNELIIDCVLEECWGGSNIGKCLVLSKRKEHLKELTKIFLEKCPAIFNGPIQFLTGDNSDQAQKISYIVDKQNGFEGSVLFSTLAEEGTDIPRLDRLFLVYPGRKLAGLNKL